MGKLFLTALVLVALGCKNEAESVVLSSNHNFDVEKLFDVDGCTVYRFTDGRSHYFARCERSVSVSETQYYHHGKSGHTESHEVVTVEMETIQGSASTLEENGGGK